MKELNFLKQAVGKFDLKICAKPGLSPFISPNFLWQIS